MFFFIPTGMNYRTERLPVITLSLIGINTLVYVVSLIFFFATQGESDGWIYEHLWLVPAASYPWMYLTSMFVHEGFFHLAGNMIFLFLFGSCVEDMIGRWRYIIFYLAGGLIANFAFIAMTPEHFHSEIPMGGASGAIMCCMGMYLPLRTSANIEFKYFVWLMMVYVRAGEFEIPAWVAIGFYFLSDLVGAILGMYSEHGGGGVAFGAHVGGFLSGLAMVSIYKWKERKQADTESGGRPDLIIDPAELIARTRQMAATSETPTIFLHDGTSQCGPFTLTQVQTMLRLGTIGPEAQYWSEGMVQWESVTDLAGHAM